MTHSGMSSLETLPSNYKNVHRQPRSPEKVRQKQKNNVMDLQRLLISQHWIGWGEGLLVQQELRPEMK